MRAEVLGLAQRHPRHDAKRHSLLGHGDDVLVPIANDDGTSIEVWSLGEFEMAG